MRWDADELPAGVLEQRLARLRTAMQRERLDAFLIYTNLVRPSAVNWVTGFTPYWSEGALLVFTDGAPVFATALSKRVSTWIKSTNPLSDIVNSPRPGQALGARIKAAGAKRVGLLELDLMPTALYDDLVAAVPEVSLTDASAVFADARRRIDDAERALLTRADAIARDALAQVDAATATDAGVVAGAVEQNARLAGAEEAYIAVAPNLGADQRLIRITKPSPLGESFAVRASIAYKGCWIRRTCTFTRSDSNAIKRADTWLDGLAGSLDPGKPLADQLTTSARALGAIVQSWMAESAIGSYPLEVIAGSATNAARLPSPGDFQVLTVALSIDGQPWLGAAPVMLPPAER
jgi:hypothetical protein